MKQRLCHLSELTPFQGCGAWIGDQQAALFYLPGDEPHVYALQHWDPIGKAYVMARGIVGDVKGEPCVASPLYKQHFSLRTGQCIEQPDVTLKTWRVLVEAEQVYVLLSETALA
ncbi:MULTISPECIES: nitrite reductase small subunit NirD [Vibrio]|uniref:nitrite reductase small subunit NirD n=1 Tax=Vibrio TaxID=662 RepID=UPI00117CAC22|nr:nitrite reductase small subunit NirD [Vibrio furnissii]QTG88693.1 nitrite reductase small subunit NirD [Vibrio furnissii]QTG96039.1 nitrite reductase small subunit NirD [Vibrio furnissii]TRN26087.1 nitrite reductase (NAD(P)H) small subunit [Vibrio furnissii]